MSHFRQKSWFVSRSQITDPSQDLFMSQELLPSQFQQSFHDSSEDLPDFSQLGSSQAFPFQSQNIEKSQLMSSYLQNRPQVFNSHHSKVQIISQSFESSIFHSQIQEELSFLEENSQFIFSQSQEQEASSQLEQPDVTPSQSYQEIFTPVQSNQDFSTPVQLYQEDFTPPQGYQKTFNQSQADQQVFDRSQTYQEAFTPSQEYQEVSTPLQSHQDVFNLSQTYQEVNTSSPSHQTSQITQIEVDEFVIPESISILHKTVRQHNSDWAYLSILSGQLCGEFFPMNAYKNLKLSLLLSLASINVNSLPVPIVAIGKETSHANLLMTKIGRLADRFLTSLMNFEGSTVDTCGTIYAGPLLLAKGGVLFIGDWSRLPAKTVMKLLREVETGQVTTEKVQQSAPLECAVWTFWSCSAKIKRDATTINQFMNVFGVPVMIDDAVYEDEIINEILGLSENEKFKIPEEDMIEFLKIVSKQQVEMEPEADEMLRDYFTATRMIRENSLSQKAFEVLKQMAESHAKLCFRSIVTVEDVLGVINISEKLVRALFDKDSYSSPPESKFTQIEDIDEYRNQLHEWFVSFTKNILHRQI